MNICIETFRNWLNHHPKAKQWGWFVILWCGGLGTVVILTYPIKLLIKSIS